jgi:hypothetical protein
MNGVMLQGAGGGGGVDRWDDRDDEVGRGDEGCRDDEDDRNSEQIGRRADDDVWQLFLTDSERAIRESAPREPAAWERVARAGRWTVEASAVERPSEWRFGGVERMDAVGELWQPPDPRRAPGWHELDGRAKCRRAGRLIGTVAAVVALLGTVSQLSSGSGRGRDGNVDTTLQQPDASSDALPTAAGAPSALPPTPSAGPFAGPSSSPTTVVPAVATTAPATVSPG